MVSTRSKTAKSNSSSNFNDSEKNMQDKNDTKKQSKTNISLLDELQVQGDIAFLGLQFTKQDISKKTRAITPTNKSRASKIPTIIEYKYCRINERESST